MSVPFDQMLDVAPMNLWCAAHKVLSAVVRDKSRNQQIRNNCQKCYCFDFRLSGVVLLVEQYFQKATEFSEMKMCYFCMQITLLFILPFALETASFQPKTIGTCQLLVVFPVFSLLKSAPCTEKFQTNLAFDCTLIQCRYSLSSQ